MRTDSSMTGSMLYSPMEMSGFRYASKSRNAEAPAARDAVSMQIPRVQGTELSEAESSVLARERALKSAAGGARTATTYTYEMGPDGKRYIVGAEVSVTGTSEELDAIPGGKRTGRQNSETAEKTEPGGDKKNAESGTSKQDDNDPQVRAAVAELQSIEREVIAHEAAHMAVGGQFAGGVSYTYTTGPDGKNYITGGEVPISTPATDDPKEALQSAEQVMRAALAPAKPSGQDHAVAANAAQIAAEARAQLASQGTEEPGSGGGNEKSPDAYTTRRAEDAYKASKSPNGLWIAENGFGDSYVNSAAGLDETAA